MNYEAQSPCNEASAEGTAALLLLFNKRGGQSSDKLGSFPPTHTVSWYNMTTTDHHRRFARI